MVSEQEIQSRARPNGLCALLFNLNHSICLAQKGRDLHIKPRDLIDNMVLFHYFELDGST